MKNTILKKKKKKKVGPEDVAELLQSRYKPLTDEELLPVPSEQSGFLRWHLLLVKMLWTLLKWQQRI